MRNRVFGRNSATKMIIPVEIMVCRISVRTSDPAKEAISGLDAPDLAALKYGPLTETPVKNVDKPLRHYMLLSDS